MNKKSGMVMNILLYLLVFMLAQFLASSLVMFFFFFKNIGSLKFSTDLMYLQEEMDNFISQYTPVIYIVSFIISILGYFIVFKIQKRNIVKEAGFSKMHFYKFFILIFVGIAANIVVDFILNAIVYYFDLEHSFSEYNVLIEKILSSNSVILLLLSTGILFPILEEVIFRGFIFNELKKNISITKAIVIQAFLFGLLHLNLIQGSYAFLLGLFFAYIYLWTESILGPITLHIGINSYTVLATKFPQLSVDNILLLVLSVFVLIMGTTVIYKTRIKLDNELI